jgi:hypothetical protein
MGWDGNVGVNQSFEDAIQYLERHKWKELERNDRVPKACRHSKGYAKFADGQAPTAPPKKGSVSAAMHLTTNRVRVETILQAVRERLDWVVNSTFRYPKEVRKAVAGWPRKPRPVNRIDSSSSLA